MTSENNSKKEMVEVGFSSSAPFPANVLKKFRNIDVYDLLIIKCLSEGFNLAAIADMLKLTQSAVSQRVKKIEQLEKSSLFVKKGRSLRLTDTGRKWAVKVSSALEILIDDLPSAQKNLAKKLS